MEFLKIKVEDSNGGKWEYWYRNIGPREGTYTPENIKRLDAGNYTVKGTSLSTVARIALISTIILISIFFIRMRRNLRISV